MSKLRIVELKTSGFRALKAVELMFSEGINVVKGFTQQGKTSVLEDVFLMFKGLKGQARDLVPHGSESSTNMVTFHAGGITYQLERVIKTDAPPTLELRELIPGAKSRKISAPQTFLDNLSSALGDTPAIFLKKTALEKLKFILTRHGTDVTLLEKEIETAKKAKDDLAAQQKIYTPYEAVPAPKADLVKKKTLEQEIADIALHNSEVTSEYDKKKAELDADFSDRSAGYQTYLAKVKELEPSRTTLNTHLTEISVEDAAIQKAEADLADRKKNLELLRKNTAEDEKALKAAEALVKEETSPDYAEYKKQCDDLLAATNASKKTGDALESELKSITEVEKTDQEYLKNHKEFLKKAEEIKTADQTLKDKKKNLYDALAAVPCKVEGLTVKMNDDTLPDGIYLNGIFSEEWSGAEAFMAASKILRRYTGQEVLLIDGGESIYNDPEAFKKFCDWAREDGVQIIISVVGSDTPDENADKVFYMEDGGVRVI